MKTMAYEADSALTLWKAECTAVKNTSRCVSEDLLDYITQHCQHVLACEAIARSLRQLAATAYGRKLTVSMHGQLVIVVSHLVILEWARLTYFLVLYTSNLGCRKQFLCPRGLLWIKNPG